VEDLFFVEVLHADNVFFFHQEKIFQDLKRPGQPGAGTVSARVSLAT
jgi:hypothetical protein